MIFCLHLFQLESSFVPHVHTHTHIYFVPSELLVQKPKSQKLNKNEKERFGEKKLK